jgi:hypothetical protein
MPFKGLEGLYELPNRFNDKGDNSFSHFIAYGEAVRAVKAYEHALTILKERIERFEEQNYKEEKKD